MGECAVRAQMELSGAEVQVLDYFWPQAHHGWDEQDRHVLSLSLSPVPSASQGRFEGMNCEPRRLGAVLFMPSHVPLESRCDGGFQRIVRCRFSPGRFKTLTRRDAGWSERELTMSQDLRSSRLQAGLRRLADEISAPGFGSATIATALAEMLAIDLVRCLSLASGTGSHCHGGLQPHKLRIIEQRIAAKDCTIPSAAELASAAGLSSRHLLRAFQESTGLTLRQRLQHEFKSRAEFLLADTTLPIGDIAERLGFRTTASFSTAFRRLSGESPREYRHRTH